MSDEIEKQSKKNAFMGHFGAVVLASSVAVIRYQTSFSDKDLEFVAFLGFVGFFLMTVGYSLWFDLWANAWVNRRIRETRERTTERIKRD